MRTQLRKYKYIGLCQAQGWGVVSKAQFDSAAVAGQCTMVMRDSYVLWAVSGCRG